LQATVDIHHAALSPLPRPLRIYPRIGGKGADGGLRHGIHRVVDLFSHQQPWVTREVHSGIRHFSHEDWHAAATQDADLIANPRPIWREAKLIVMLGLDKAPHPHHSLDSLEEADHDSAVLVAD
jgi:hypothetical protein